MAVDTSRKPAPLSLDDLPPLLRKHVEACRAEGLDLLPWIDPFPPVPRRPILEDLKQFRNADLRKRRPKDHEYVGNRLQRLIEHCDLFEAKDIKSSVLQRYFRGMCDEGSPPPTIRGYLYPARWFSQWLSASGRLPEGLLDGLEVPSDGQAELLSANELSVELDFPFQNMYKHLQRLRKKRPPGDGWIDRWENGAPHRRPRYLYDVQVAQDIVRRRRAGVVARRSIHADRAFLFHGQFEDADSLTFHNVPKIVDDLVRPGGEEASRFPDLNMKTPDGRQKAQAKVRREIRWARRILLTERYEHDNRPRHVGSYFIVCHLFTLWRRIGLSNDEIRKRWNAFPEKLRIILAGWQPKHYCRIPGGGRLSQWMRVRIKAVESRARAQNGKTSVTDKRGYVFRQKREADWTDREIFNWWNGLLPVERKALSPGKFSKLWAVKQVGKLIEEADRAFKKPECPPARSKHDYFVDYLLKVGFAKEEDWRAWESVLLRKNRDWCERGARHWNEELTHDDRLNRCPDSPGKLTAWGFANGAWKRWCERNPVLAANTLGTRPAWKRDHHCLHRAREIGEAAAFDEWETSQKGRTQICREWPKPFSQGPKHRTVGRGNFSRAIRKADWEEGVLKAAEEAKRANAAEEENPPAETPPGDATPEGGEVQQVVIASDSDAQADTKTDKIATPPQRQRPVNVDVADCARFVKLQLEINPTENRKSLVEQWCEKHGASSSSVYRTLSDYPKLWQPDVSDGHA